MKETTFLVAIPFPNKEVAKKALLRIMKETGYMGRVVIMLRSDYVQGESI